MISQDSKFWLRYKKGIEYLDSKNLVTRSNRDWNFYVGKQWEGVESGGEDLPFHNFIKRDITRKVTTIYKNRMSVHYADMDGRTEVDGVQLQPIYDKLSEMFAAKWEKANQDVLMRLTLKNACITGDGIQYYGTRNVEDVQLLDNTSVLFGDESEPNIQRQPYIIIHERKSVDAVKKLARENGVSESELSLITADDETDNIIGNRDEVKEMSSTDSRKVTLITHFEKKKEPLSDGTFEDVVYVCKCTKHLIVEPEHPVRGEASLVDRNQGKKGRALRLYPLVKMSWENFPNDARGVSQVEYLIPNQIEINKTLVRRSMVTKLSAYPRTVYDENALVNPEALESVGTPLAVASGGVSSVRELIGYLEPANVSSEPKRLMDDILEITQELSGTGDTTTGNIDLQRVAASAIQAVNEKAESMFDETLSNMEMFTEDLADLWVELWQVYSPNGLTVNVKKEMPVQSVDPMTGMPKVDYEEMDVQEEIPKEELDLIKPTTRIDVSKDNEFARQVEQEWLDGALNSDKITLEEYSQLIPSTGSAPKAGLERIIKRRKTQMEQQQPNQMQDPTQYALSQWSAQDNQAGA